jgi:DNA adenine methylase
MSDESVVAPFLKWAGGKSRLIPQYEPYLPAADDVSRYFEPFIGSAALFFHLRPRRALLGDVNANLVTVYRAVQCEPEAVIAALRRHRNTADHYYAVRAQDPTGLPLAERAARLIYLNKTCYNGLYRENSRGEFNVPFGRYKRPKICDAPRLRAAAAALTGVSLVVGDFATLVAGAGERDYVYFDPPYVPLSLTSNFTSYDRRGFGEGDQRRLAETVAALTKRGCRVMLSNSDAPLVRELYAGRGYRLIPIQARRNINSRADRRGPVQELLILNY